MKNWTFRQWNTLLGWVTFVIAFFTYLSTMEPNFSFWDCGEYISSAVKLEVTHAPGSVLEKANLYAQLYGQSTEFLLSRSLKLATANLTPLDDKGVQQWPKTGDDADFVLLNASCSAEAVSRISNVESLIYRGNVVF